MITLLLNFSGRINTMPQNGLFPNSLRTGGRWLHWNDWYFLSDPNKFVQSRVQPSVFDTVVLDLLLSLEWWYVWSEAEYEKTLQTWFLPCIYFYAPDHRKGAIRIGFVCLSVHPSVAYIANNSRTQKPSMSKFGTKVSHLRCDSHTIFKVKGQGYRRAGAYRVGWTRWPHCLLEYCREIGIDCRYVIWKSFDWQMPKKLMLMTLIVTLLLQNREQMVGLAACTSYVLLCFLIVFHLNDIGTSLTLMYINELVTAKVVLKVS